MPQSRKGFHGDVVYVLEDNGFDSEPNDDVFKGFGSNLTVGTYDASHNAVRDVNAGRAAEDIIKQVFEGSWGVSFDLGAEPPWWLASVFGLPESESVSGSIYDHTFTLDNDNEPVSMRMYLPTDGFNEYLVVPGVTPESVTVDQSNPNNPDVTLSCSYARSPFTDTTLSPSVPSFSKKTFSNRYAELQIGSDTVGRQQNANLQINTGSEIHGEIGSGHGVDFTPGAFEPDLTHDKIVWIDQDVDYFQRFKDAEIVTSNLIYDNGMSGDDQYILDWATNGSFPNTWSETGRNDPDNDLMEELQEMGQTVDVTMTVDEAETPGLAA